MPKLYGTGKKTVIKHLKDQNLSLSSLSDTAATFANVYAKSTKLISSYYGIKNTNKLSEVRFSVWGKRTGKKLKSNPELEFLPQTKKEFLLKALRAHYQTCIWNSCLHPRPQEMDPCHVKYLIIESGQSCSLSEFLVIHIYLPRNWTLKKKKHLLDLFCQA